MRLVIAILAASAIIPSAANVRSPQATPAMFAHIIDIGQGASALLEFPCGAILLDAGSQGKTHSDYLISYLTNFFQKRADLNKTLEAIIISHNHQDHALALKEVVLGFKVKRYIDQGDPINKSYSECDWVRANAQTDGRDIAVREILEPMIPNPYDAGLTNADIDPVACEACDPAIHILTGGLPENIEGWGDEYDTLNNHSLVVRVDFGQSSFLFTGDSEEVAQERVLRNYSTSSVLDVDVYHVGHHGSKNGTISEFVDAMTPKIALISAGKHDDGDKSMSAYQYGHPHKDALTLLQQKIAGKRNKAVEVMVGVAGSAPFVPMTITKKIFATSWDNTFKLRANLAGEYRAYIDQ